MILPIIVIIIILLAVVSYLYQVNRELHSWGEEGLLSVEIELDKNVTMKFEGAIVNYKLTNIGDTKLRVLLKWKSLTDLLIIRDENGTYMYCQVVWEPPPDPKNSDLEILEPGESTGRTLKISEQYYDFNSNSTYSVWGKYMMHDVEYLTLPYWKGEIYTEEKFLHIL